MDGNSEVEFTLAPRMTKLTVKSKRHYSAHHALLRAADNYLTAAENSERFCSDGHFVSLVMSCLAVESLCNTTGDLIFTDWEDFESASPRAKIRMICAQLGILYEREKEPFHTLLWTIRFRNKIAHAKPEPLDAEVEMSEEECADLMSGDGPQSKLEKQVTFQTARRVFDAISLFQKMVVEKLPEDKKYLVDGDFWESSFTETRS